MVKRCIYCNYEISDSSVVDICKPCMHKVWGEKMSAAIIGGMEKEKDKGNLELGDVGNSTANIQKENKEEPILKIEDNSPEISPKEIQKEVFIEPDREFKEIENVEEFIPESSNEQEFNSPINL